MSEFETENEWEDTDSEYDYESEADYGDPQDFLRQVYEMGKAEGSEAAGRSEMNRIFAKMEEEVGKFDREEAARLANDVFRQNPNVDARQLVREAAKVTAEKRRSQSYDDVINKYVDRFGVDEGI
jgi:hypothetical protein